jgi:hypothetical protein
MTPTQLDMSEMPILPSGATVLHRNCFDEILGRWIVLAYFDDLGSPFAVCCTDDYGNCVGRQAEFFLDYRQAEHAYKLRITANSLDSVL